MKEYLKNIKWDKKTIGVLSGLISQLAMILGLTVFVRGILADIMGMSTLIFMVIGYVCLGKYALKGIFSVCKKMFVFGWIVTPFPIDIFTGIMCTGAAFAVGLGTMFFFPSILTIWGYFQAKKDGQ